MQTMISKDIYTADYKAGYDEACKRLLSEKIILAWIMKSCLDEYRELDVFEIADKYIEGTVQAAEVNVMPDDTGNVLIHGIGTEDVTMTEGTVVYDIRFLSEVPGDDRIVGLIVNVEAQNDFYPGYPLLKRAIYYCSRMISSQQGTVFDKSHYEKIKKVYSVWICVNPPKNRTNTITKYEWTEKNLVGSISEAAENYDLMSVIVICLGDSEHVYENDLLRLLNVLLSADIRAEQKQRILQADYSIPMTEKIENEVLFMCNLSDGVEQRGIEKGIEKGVLVSLRNLMKTLKFTAEQAMDALMIPEEEQFKYSEMLKQK